MLPEPSSEIASYPKIDVLPVIVIGAGPVGVRVVLELCRQLPDCHIHLFSGEPWAPQQSNKPSAFLAAAIDQAELVRNINLSDKFNITAHFNEYVIGIDRENCTVTTRYGNRYEYWHLILATGSNPNVPRIPGIDLAGVYTFKDITDTQQLYASMTRSRHTVVIGGGVLGLEAAKAMRRFNTRVTVIEHNAHLMFQQLDVRGAELLQRHIESLGIRIHTNESVRQILGSLSVQGVELRSGGTFKCDTIILAAGVQPNVDLASEAGLATGRGILVNDRMQSSDPRIYAVGECVEHGGMISGLITPGYEQAYVVARTIADRPATYAGTTSVTSLKVAGYPIFSMGDIKETQWQREDPVFFDKRGSIYRKLIIERDRPVGVIAVGEWSEIPRLRDMVYNHRRIMPWHRWRFLRTGHIWRTKGNVDLLNWPAVATLCHCTGISVARLHRELINGADSFEELTTATGAGSVCGDCKPLLNNLICCARDGAVGNRRILAGVSFLVTLLTLPYLLSIELANTGYAQNLLPWDGFFQYRVFQQSTGYSLLVLVIFLGVYGLRKRYSRCNWGRVAGWRLFHVILGLITITLLMVHAGMRMGQGSDLWLMLNFTALILTGSLHGSLHGLGYWLTSGWIRRTRILSLLAHLLLLWPLPLLLGLHITMTYDI